MKRRNKKEKPKTFKWYLNIILAIIYCITPLIGFILMAWFYNNDNIFMACLILYILYPSLGVIMAPNFMLYAIKNNKKAIEDLSARKNHIDMLFLKAENKNLYRSKILFSIVYKALSTLIITSITLLAIFLLGAYFFENGGIDRLESRPMIRKLIATSSEVEGGAFLLVFGFLIFSIPIIMYIITDFAYKIYIVINKKYYSYYARVLEIDSNGIIHVRGTKEISKYKFKEYKCIGIRKKDIVNKNVIVVFVSDMVYLINDEPVTINIDS